MQREASYTVELALLMPILFLAVLLPIYTGFRLYEKTQEVSVYVEREYHPEEGIRMRQIKKELQEDKEDGI